MLLRIGENHNCCYSCRRKVRLSGLEEDYHNDIAANSETFFGEKNEH